MIKLGKQIKPGDSVYIYGAVWQITAVEPGVNGYRYVHGVGFTYRQMIADDSEFLTAEGGKGNEVATSP